MDKVGSKEEAQNGRFVRTQQEAESHEAFNKIKEKSDPGTFNIIAGLVFIFINPMILFAIIPLGPYFTWDGTELCCGSILLGFVILVVGSNQSAAHWSRYNKAAQDLQHDEDLFFSESEKKSNKTKPQKIVLSQRKEE